MADPRLDWDLVRVFLAVIRSGSMRAAAAQMCTSHPTVRRRLKALEQQLGFTLFDRGADSMRPTPRALALVERAEAIEAAVHGFTRDADNSDPQLAGLIRVSAPDLLMSDLLAPDLVAFCRRWPHLELQVETTYQLANLGNREADVAFRLMPPSAMPANDLAGRRVAATCLAAYGHGDCWLGWGDQVQQRQWIQQTGLPELPIRGVFDNVYLQRAACLEGMGMVLLPCFMADPFLERRCPPIPAGDLWILVHPDLRDNARLRIFRDEMVAAIQRLRPRLEGRES